MVEFCNDSICCWETITLSVLFLLRHLLQLVFVLFIKSGQIVSIKHLIYSRFPILLESWFSNYFPITICFRSSYSISFSMSYFISLGLLSSFSQFDQRFASIIFLKNKLFISFFFCILILVCLHFINFCLSLQYYLTLTDLDTDLIFFKVRLKQNCSTVTHFQPSSPYYLPSREPFHSHS